MPTPQRRPHGRALNRGHLTDADVLAIRRMLDYGATLATAAEAFRTSVKNVWSIKVRRTWKHLP